MRIFFHKTNGSSVNQDGGASLRSSFYLGNRNSLSRFGGIAGSFHCLRWSVLALPLLLSACQTTGKNTIAELRNTRIEIKEEKIEDVPEKAIESYRRFLDETPDSALKPEAIRRLADLKVEREYDLLSGDTAAERQNPAKALPAPERVSRPDGAPTRSSVPVPARNRVGESQADFEKRAVRTRAPASALAASGSGEGADNPEGARRP